MNSLIKSILLIIFSLGLGFSQQSVMDDEGFYLMCEKMPELIGVIDGCQGDDIHTVVDGETVHSEGSYFNNFDGELELMQPFYDSYEPAIPSSEINSDHFTHGTWNTSEADTDKEYWDRK